ncbi:hypothetical protein M7I_7417 [Glarea lozoyensis 74030]|uniref:Extracellular serine-rich protein n=1 Tax=Glarea lozoyensis (strain ATCC 74030 / MF5533) TaxID=1104152 RepID=H0EX87_GLAL7|nr:hypothetical protein M7I_7417 [Glarea lozoyensis 74030]
MGLVSISNDAGFTTAGLKTGATLGTLGLYHYPANITDRTIATEFAQFDVATAEGFKSKSTAGVINKINGREQMVFFIGSSTDWSLTSNFLQHAWVHWGTRGLYAGFRRAIFTPQVDDIFLLTPLYDHNTTEFRVRGADLDNHVAWIPKITKKLNTGSSWFMEIGHNGNGNIEETELTQNDESLCKPGAIEYADQVDTPLEFVKPLGSGTDLWPAKMVTYAKDGKYTSDCIENDELMQWFMDSDNLNSFAHISHTFTHMDQNNATYADALREITWNTAWLKSAGLSKAKKYTVDGIIPPAITGLHNGDALRAWADAGIKHVVGDNTRSILLNQCDLPACTVAEWQKFSSGKGDFKDLLVLEKNTNVRHLLSLRHDPFMFHQANMRVDDVADTTVNGVKGQYSLLMAWVDTVVTEFVRLVKWPVVSQKQDELAASFMSRMNRDACKPALSWTIDTTAKTITGVTLSAKDLSCKEKLPVTLPGPVSNVQGATKEQLGSDPLTLWVTLTGKPVTFTLTTPIPLSAA